MASNKTINKNGTVTESLPNTMFRVDMEDGSEVLATLKGKLRRSYVRIFPGDKVTIELTPYDDKRGRIIRKFKKRGRN